MHTLNLMRAAALALSLAGCASVPTLGGPPEDVANAIGGNAVAYNQAYGRAIADQVLLNVLRARDRLPLYHLSMSGIGDSSELAVVGGFTVNGFSLGDGDGGVGEITGTRTLTTKPTYELNPFSHDNDHPGVTAFEPIPPEFFEHYWDNEWPRDVLLLVMVDSMDTRRRSDSVRYINAGSSYRNDCTGAQNTRGEGCAYLAQIDAIANDPNARLSLNCGAWPAHVDGQPQRPRTCDPKISAGGRIYHLELRALDDMIYYVGGLMRVTPVDGVSSSNVKVQPTGVYRDDTLPRGHRPAVGRTAPLFRITATRPRERSDFAAQTTYNGQRYIAGPPISANCVVGNAACVVPHEGDRSALVLSLLTQLVVLSQSNATQEAPERVLTR